MLRKAAKTRCTLKAALCLLGGFTAYMQLGVALFIHANLQPYVANTFFIKDDSALVTDVDQIYGLGSQFFFLTYLVYALCILGMVLGLALGKKFLATAADFSTGGNHSPRKVYFVSSLLANACMLGSSFLVTAVDEF